MSAALLLEEVRGLGVTLFVEGGSVRWRGPKGVMTPELLARLSEQKAAILLMLKAAVDPEDEEEAKEEAKKPKAHYLPCGCPTEICWPCCNRPCVMCGKLTGSAFLSLCTRCGLEGDRGGTP
jgi:hypothetical protein